MAKARAGVSHAWTLLIPQGLQAGAGRAGQGRCVIKELDLLMKNTESVQHGRNP